MVTSFDWTTYGEGQSALFAGRPGDRWKQIQPNAVIANQVAKQTALNALLRRPMDVATLGAKTFLHYWNFKHIRRQARVELGKALNNWPNKKTWDVATHFHLSPPLPREAKTIHACCNDTLCVHSHTITWSCYHLSFVSVLYFSCPRGMFLCFFSIAGFSLEP